MSTLSIRLKERARVLAAGAVMFAATLTMLPSLAQAQDLAGADVGSTVDGSVESVAPAASGGGEAITSDTDLAGEQNLTGEEGLVGDSAFISDNTVPASVTGVVTADAEANTPVADQTGTLCVDVNAPNCGQQQQPVAGEGAGGMPASGSANLITSVTDVASVNEVGAGGINSHTALVSDKNAPVPASGVATGDVALESPAGNQNLTACGTLNADACMQAPASGTPPNSGNSIISDTDLAGEQNLTGEEGLVGDSAFTSDNTVPASVTGVVTADVEANTPVADQTGTLCVDVNAPNCGQQQQPAGGTTPNGDGVIAVDSINEASQQLTNDGLVGDLDSNTDVDASALPASGVVTGDGNVAIPGVANENFDLCATLNRNGCAEAPVPGGNAPGGNAGAGPGNNNPIDVDSSTIINEALANGGLNGDASNNTVITAPLIPANGSVVVDGNAAVGEIVNQNAGVCLLLNRAGCGENTAPPAGGNGTPPNSGGNPITSVTDVIGNQNAGPGGSTGTTLIDSVTTAPVPASVLVTANGNAAVDGVLNQGIGACLAVNANCGQAAAPGNNAGGGNSGGTTPGGTGGTNPDGTTPDGNAGGTSPGDGASADPGGDDGAASSGGNSGVSPNGSAGANSGGSVTNLGDNASGTAPGGSANSTNLANTTSGSNAAGTTLGNTILGSGANRSALALAQPSVGGPSADGGSQASASGGSSSASSGSQEASTSLPSTGGVSPLLMIMMLLFIGAGIFFLLVTTRRNRRLTS